MMKNEYLEREIIIEHAAKIKSRFAPLHRPVIEAFVYSLKDLPNAEVEPVKYGEWLPYTEYYADDYSECNTRKVWTCSRCGRLEKYKEPYCNCGAKMTGGANQ